MEIRHERYCYLLGIEIGQVSAAPERSLIKQVPAAAYAKACFCKGENIIKAWNDFFYKEIPQAGLEVNKQLNAYWQNRYICGTQGGWLHDRVLNPIDLDDVFEFVKTKRKPYK